MNNRAHWYYFLVRNTFILLLLFTLSGCIKEQIDNENYMGNFWGQSTSYTPDTIEFYELDIPLSITKTNENSFLVNQESFLTIFNDSIEGTINIPNTSYLIDPFLIGKFSKHDGNYYFEGSYAAIKDSTQAIMGTFEIVPDL